MSYLVPQLPSYLLTCSTVIIIFIFLFEIASHPSFLPIKKTIMLILQSAGPAL
jgi:hypothetical protein